MVCLVWGRRVCTNVSPHPRSGGQRRDSEVFSQSLWTGFDRCEESGSFAVSKVLVWASLSFCTSILVFNISESQIGFSLSEFLFAIGRLAF